MVQGYATSRTMKEELISGVAVMVLAAPEAAIIVTEVTIGIGAMLLLGWYYVHARRRRKKQREYFMKAEKQRRQGLRRDETRHVPLEDIPQQIRPEIAELRRQIRQLEDASNEFWRQRGEM